MPRRRSLLSPSTRGILQLAAQVILCLALFTVLQFLATRHNVRFDLTPTQSFVLSPQAKQVASAFTKPARITIFYNSQSAGQRREMIDLLEQFRAAAPNISFRLLDLDRSPGLAKKFGVSSYNTGVVEVGDEITDLRSIDETEITSVLLKFSRTRTRTLCFVTGHGERSPENASERDGYSQVAKALERERFTITTISTIPSDGVPERCTVVILAGPSHDLLPGEDEALDLYLRSGGKVLLLADPDAPPSVLQFLRDAGVEAGNDIIVDEQNRFIGADSFMPQVVKFRTDIFRDVDAPAVLSLARTVRPREEKPPAVRIISIAATSPGSWARVNGGSTPDEDIRFRRKIDQAGPLSVGILATFKNEPRDGEAMEDAPTGELMVFGDSDFATNFYLNLLGNRDLIMSSIAVLAADPELIAVRRKGLPRGSISPISLTARQGRVIFWTAVVILPGGFLLLGGVLALTRRRQHGGR